MNIEISSMTLEDLDDIMIIEYASFSIPWSRESFEEELISNSFAVYLTARSNGRVIGYGGMWKVLDEGHITNIAVHPDFRQLNVGSSLLSVLMQYALNNGIKTMTLEVRESNIAAQRLYSKFNFKIAGRRKGYYSDNREDALIMNAETIDDNF